MAENTREKIINAAFTLFSKIGFKGTTTRKIAKTAGVNESTIFRLFENKESLVREILSRSSAMMTIINVIKESDANRDSGKILKEIAGLFVNMYRNHPDLVKIFLRCAIDHEEMEYIEDSMGPGAYQYLVDLFVRLEEAGSIALKTHPEKAAFFFLSLVHGACQRAMIFREIDVVDTDELISLFTRGVL